MTEITSGFELRMYYIFFDTYLLCCKDIEKLLSLVPTMYSVWYWQLQASAEPKYRKLKENSKIAHGKYPIPNS